MCSVNTSSIFLLLAKIGGDRGRWVGTEGGRWRQGTQGEVGRFSWSSWTRL